MLILKKSTNDPSHHNGIYIEILKVIALYSFIYGVISLTIERSASSYGVDIEINQLSTIVGRFFG